MPTDFGSFLDENQDNWDKITGTKKYYLILARASKAFFVAYVY